MKNRLISLLTAGCLIIGSGAVPALAAGFQEAELPAEITSAGEETAAPEEETGAAGTQDGETAPVPEETVQSGFQAEDTGEPEAGSQEDPVFAAEDTEEAEDALLYHGQEANYDDPQFGSLLEEGFFDLQGAADTRDRGTVHDEKFDGYTIENGIDVSQWNADIQWDLVAEEKDFALIRAAYRGTGTGTLSTDPYFAQNIREATATDLDVGVYIFSQAITTDEAVEEANYLLDLVEGYDISLPLVLDYEYSSGGRLETAGLSAEEHTDICLAFCETIEAAGYDAMVYANQNMLSTDLDGQAVINAGYELWLAQYNSAATYEGDYSYWQYTDSGTVSGIEGSVDLNYRYIADEDAGTEEPETPDTQERLETPALKSASLTSEEDVRVSWETVEGADGYLLFRKTEDSSWEKVGISTTGSYDDNSDLAYGTVYTYSVRAYRGTYEEAIANTYKLAYWSGYSAEGVQFVLLETPQPTSAAAVSTGVQVKWEKVEGAEEYQVYRRALGSSWTPIDTSDTNSYIDTDTLKSGTTYVYTVRALNGSCRSDYVGTGVRLCYLSIPQLTSVNGGANGVKVQWKAVTGAEGYDVYRRVPGESWSKVARVDSNSYTDSSSMTNGSTYIYTVRAYNGSDRSYYVNTGIRLTYLSAPELVRVSQSPVGLRVTWRTVDGADGYYIYRRALGTSWTRIATADADATTYTDPNKNLKVGTTYVYTVKAFNESTQSAYDSTGVRRVFES